MANNAWNIVKALRDHNFPADLIVNAKEFGMGNPLWELLEIDQDPYNFNMKKELDKIVLPEWCKIWYPDDLHIAPQNILHLMKMVKPYRLLHCHPPSQIYLQFLGKDFVIHEAGWFYKLCNLDNISEKLGRRAMKYARAIVMTNPHHYRMLPNLPHKTKFVFIPFIINTDYYKPMKVKKGEGDLFFFHPARQYWRYKQNWKLFEAFRKFIDAGYRAKLRCVYWGFLEEVNKSLELIKKLKLEAYVEWIEPVSKPRLIKLYNQADAVFDQFGCGSSGTVGFETMSCGKPLVIYLNREWHLDTFGEVPPILNARSPEQIFEMMKFVAEQPEACKKIGEAEREFVLKYNHADVVAPKFIKLYEDLGVAA
jgi:glycosyltransferase involved in cell wall biosynthesis